MKGAGIMIRRTSAGYSFSELLVALFILSIGILGLMKLQMTSVQRNAFTGRMTTAIALAQRQMETLINQSLEATGGIFDPATNPWPSADSQASVDPDPEVDPVVNDTRFRGYTLDWEVTANAPVNDTATLRVEVQWPGGNHPITLVSFKRR